MKLDKVQFEGFVSDGIITVSMEDSVGTGSPLNKHNVKLTFVFYGGSKVEITMAYQKKTHTKKRETAVQQLSPISNNSCSRGYPPSPVFVVSDSLV